MLGIGNSIWSSRKGEGPPPLPDMLLDLTNPNTALQLTTVRANYGWADDSAGYWSAFPPSIPRITDKGLLIEEQRINSIRNNSMTGAVVGTPGTMPTGWSFGGAGTTFTVVGQGQILGLVDYIDVRIQGTSGSFIDAESALQIVAASGQVWTGSHFLAMVGGSLANITALSMLVIEATAAGAFLAGSNVNIQTFLSSTLVRYVLTRTLDNAGTARVHPRISITPSGAFDITLRIGWPQLELGAFATSPIRTTSAAVQRNADVITVANFAGWFNQSAGTLCCDGLINRTPTLNSWLADISNGTTDEEIGIYVSGSGAFSSILRDNVTTIATPAVIGGHSANVSFKAAIAWQINDMVLYADGVTGVPDISLTLPTPNQIGLGRRADGSFVLNGYIRRVTYWASRLTNGQLSAITVPDSTEPILIPSASHPVIEYRQWTSQHAEKPWSMSRAYDNTYTLRFEIREGDVASEGHRSELTGHPFLVPKGVTFKGHAQFMVEPGPQLSSWCLLHQIHHDDRVGDSPPFAVEMDNDDHVFVVVRNNAGTQNFLGTSATPLQRGRWYEIQYSVKLDGDTGDNNVSITIKDDTGATFYSQSRTNINIGYNGALFNYVKLGVYCDHQPEPIAVQWRNFSLAFNNVTPKAVTANSPARVLPRPLLKFGSPTWAFATATQLVDAWTDYIYEREANITKYDYLYDQSDGGQGLGLSAEADQPLYDYGKYIIGALFEGAGDRMLIQVNDDSDDVISASNFYICMIISPTAIPTNDVASPANNNNLIFGENSEARNFGVVIRDNLTGANGPWELQFFIKDAGGEKIVSVANSLPKDKLVFVECEHTGAAIRARVDQGAWSTLAAGPIAVMTGFPRIGHCGTSYIGRIFAIATFKTPPSDLARILMYARFQAMRDLVP